MNFKVLVLALLSFVSFQTCLPAAVERDPLLPDPAGFAPVVVADNDKPDTMNLFHALKCQHQALLNNVHQDQAVANALQELENRMGQLKIYATRKGYQQIAYSIAVYLNSN